MNRRRFLKYASATTAIVGASALGLNYLPSPQQRSPSLTDSSTASSSASSYATSSTVKGSLTSSSSPGSNLISSLPSTQEFLGYFHKSDGFDPVNFYDWDPSLGNVKWWNGQTFAGARAKSRLGDYVGDNHTGTDFAAKAGTVIPSPASGQVTFTSVTNGSMWVQLAHDNGFSTSYNHVSKTLVELGQAVKKGQPIALVGESGTWYPHLHFELLLPIYDHLAILDPFRPVWPLDMASSGYWGFDNGRVWWVRVPPTENPNGLGYWIGGNPNE